MKVIRIGIIEDQPLVMENLTAFFEQLPTVELVFKANLVEDFLENAASTFPIDILLLDIGLPGGMTGIQGIPLIHKMDDKIDIIMLSSYEDSERIFKALRAGAIGYVSKKSSLVKIKEAIETIHLGGSYMSPSIARKVVAHFSPKPAQDDSLLTTRQKEIVEGLANGLSYKMIAAELSISLETVRDHIKKIYKKLGVNSKAEVISKKLKGEI